MLLCLFFSFPPVRITSPILATYPKPVREITILKLRFFGLPETGELDDETIYQMKKPRCGVPDVYNENGRVKRSPYPGTVRKWRQTYFTYFVYKGEDLPESEQQRIFAKAFNIWKAAAPRLRFTREKTQEYEPTKADLKIR